MTFLDWVAVFGALAWLPPIYGVVKSHFTKSNIRIITQKSASIGFTTNGPIFNLGIAFSVKNKDIVISDLKIRVKHESGEEKIFEWQGITQQVGKLTTPDSSVMPFEKEQSVLAIKLNQKDIEERFIRCQEVSFISTKSEYEAKAVRKISYLQSEEKYNPSEFLREQEMKEIYSFIKHSFPWKQGVYIATIEIKSPEKFTIIENSRKFILSHLDIELLSKNKEFIEREYKRVMLGELEQEETFSWNWCNPILTKT